MKLKKLLKLFDPLGQIRIFSDEDDEEPIYEGIILDTPWWIVELPIAKEINGQEPIHTWYTEGSNYTEGLLVLCVHME